MLRFLCKKCGKRMKVTDDDVGRKIRCPACTYSTAVPPIKLNAKTYHFEYSVCDSLNSASSPGRNAPGMPTLAEPAGASLGGVSLNTGSSPNIHEAQEPTPSHLQPLRPGAKLAPSPKDPARYQAAVAASRTRTAAARLRPSAAPPAPMPQAPAPVSTRPAAVEPPPAPRPAPRPVIQPIVEKPPAPPARLAPLPAAVLVPPKPAPAPETEPAVLVGILAPTPQDPVRYEAAIAVSRHKTALLHQADPQYIPAPAAQESFSPSEQTEPLPAVAQEPQPEPVPAPEPQPESQSEPLPQPQVAQRPESPVVSRPEAPAIARRLLQPPAPEPEPQAIPERVESPIVSQRPESPVSQRPEAPTRRAASLVGSGYVPRAGMPRPIIAKPAAPEPVFTNDAPDNAPLPSSGRVDPAAQALAQMAQILPPGPSHPTDPEQAFPARAVPMGDSGSYDPAEALRQLALAASGAPADDQADADALTGLARYTTVDRKPSVPSSAKPPAKPASAPPAPEGPIAPLPLDLDRYEAALATSREKTRQATGN